jgi:hypothetical protein
VVWCVFLIVVSGEGARTEQVCAHGEGPGAVPRRTWRRARMAESRLKGQGVSVWVLFLVARVVWVGCSGQSGADAAEGKEMRGGQRRTMSGKISSVMATAGVLDCVR